MNGKRLLLLTVLVSLFAACEANPASKQGQNDTVEVKPELEYQLASEVNIDWNEDGVREKVALWYRNDTTMSLKIKTGSEEDRYVMPEIGYPEHSEKIILEKGKLSAVSFIMNYYEPEATIQNTIDEKRASLVVGRKDGKFAPLLNTMQHTVHQKDNYMIVYDGDAQLTITDKSTGFIVSFKLDNIENSLFKNNVQDTDMNKIFQPSTWYTEVKMNQGTDQGNAEIICVKLIPGFQREYPLGFFEYHYTWKNGQFDLTKEIFFSAKGVFIEEPKVIKQMLFD